MNEAFHIEDDFQTPNIESDLPTFLQVLSFP
jgi:hypothetical protein